MNTLLVTHNPRYQNLKQLYVDAFKNLYCKRPFTARIAVSNPNSKEEKRTIEDMLTYEQAF